jgi:drug/metabolite transporter (DMT)-like permease
MSEKLRAHLLLLAVVAIWGSTFVLVKDALNDISPLLFNLIRMALLGGAVAGFFLAVGYQFQTAGLALTTPSKSAFLTGLTVIIVPLLSVVPALRVPGSLRPGWNAYLGALVALLGITLMTAPGLFSRNLPASGTGINLGDVLTLGCALRFCVSSDLPRPPCKANPV